MARSTGSTTRIDCASGVVDLSGGFSAVGVAYRTGGTQLLSVLEADTNLVADFRVASGQMNAFIGSFRPPSVAVNITASAWYLLAWSKQPGTTVMRYHAYDMAAGTWTRSDSATFASPTATAGMVRLGNGSGASPSTGWNGAVAACALWNRGLSDAELDRLPYSLAAWLAAGPSAMWVLDQHTTATAVRDLTGGGANQTAISGTSVSTLSVPVLSYGHPIIAATRDGAGAGGDPVTSGTARAVATATATVTTTRTTTGAASATATATAATTTTRTTAGVARAVATASAATSKQATTTGTAAATASASAAHGTDRYTAGVARAVATATAVTSQSGSHTTTGTARALAGATASHTTDRYATGAATATAAATSAHTTTRTTTGRASALAGAHATTTTTRTTTGVARAVATARAVTSQSGRTVVRPYTGTVTRPYTGVVHY